MQAAAATGMELVAICDIWEERLMAEGKALNVLTFVDYDEFLGCDMDAVVLANYFHQHAPFAIKALNAGKHVMSETAACHTLGEGVALARAVEQSGKIYMFAENYPYMVFNQEMKRLYQQGRVGEFKYGEGEYVHPDPPEVKLARSCGRDHWRNWIPSTYYCTHSIAPVMYITDTRPVKVNGFVIPFDFADPTQTLHMNRSDTAAVIICRMDNDAVMKSLHGALRGHGNYVRIHGNKGVMETAATATNSGCACGTSRGKAQERSSRNRVQSQLPRASWPSGRALDTAVATSSLATTLPRPSAPVSHPISTCTAAST